MIVLVQAAITGLALFLVSLGALTLAVHLGAENPLPSVMLGCGAVVTAFAGWLWFRSKRRWLGIGAGLVFALGLHILAAFGPKFVVVVVNQTGTADGAPSLVVEHMRAEATLARPGWRLHVVPMPKRESSWWIDCGGEDVVGGYFDGMTELNVVVLRGCAMRDAHRISVV